MRKYFHAYYISHKPVSSKRFLSFLPARQTADSVLTLKLTLKSVIALITLLTLLTTKLTAIKEKINGKILILYQ